MGFFDSFFNKRKLSMLKRKRAQFFKAIEFEEKDIDDLADYIPDFASEIEKMALNEANFTQIEMVGKVQEMLKERKKFLNLEETKIYEFNVSRGTLYLYSMGILSIICGLLFIFNPELMTVRDVSIESIVSIPIILLLTACFQVVNWRMIVKRAMGWKYTRAHFAMWAMLSRFSGTSLESEDGFEEVEEQLIRENNRASTQAIIAGFAILLQTISLIGFIFFVEPPTNISPNPDAGLSIGQNLLWLSSSLATGAVFVTFIFILLDPTVDFDAGQKMGLLRVYDPTSHPMVLNSVLSEVIDSLLDPISAQEWAEYLDVIKKHVRGDKPEDFVRAVEKLLFMIHLWPVLITNKEFLDEVAEVLDFDTVVPIENLKIGDYLRPIKSRDYGENKIDTFQIIDIQDGTASGAFLEGTTPIVASLDELMNEEKWRRVSPMEGFLNSPEAERRIFCIDELKNLVNRAMNLNRPLFNILDRLVFDLQARYDELLEKSFYFSCDVQRIVEGEKGNVFIFLASTTLDESEFEIEVECTALTPSETLIRAVFKEGKTLTLPPKKQLIVDDDGSLKMCSEGEFDVIGMVSQMLESGKLYWLTVRPHAQGESYVSVRVRDQDGGLLDGKTMRVKSIMDKKKIGPLKKEHLSGLIAWAVGLSIPIIRMWGFVRVILLSII